MTRDRVIVGTICALVALIWIWALGDSRQPDPDTTLHFVTTHNMIELDDQGKVGNGSAYRDDYGWLCVRPKTHGARFERSDIIVVEGNPLLVCHWRAE